MFYGCKGTTFPLHPQSLFIWIFTLLALAHSLEHEDSGRDADVERISNAQHRNADMGIGSLTPLVSQSRSLSTHHNSGRLTHIGIVIQTIHSDEEHATQGTLKKAPVEERIRFGL